MDVAVLGAGRVGRGVAQVCALAGHDVSLQDDEANVVMDGIDAVERSLGDAVEAGTLDRTARDDAVDGLDGTTGLEAAVGAADVVVETQGSDAGTLRERFADVEALCGRETLIATGVRAVSVTAAAAGLRHPDRAVGLVFRDPLESPLVEVVVADQTTRETADAAVAFVEGLDRHPILVADEPGEATTRLVLAQEVEAMRLVEAGVASVPAVDEALRLGYDEPAGARERADRAGLDERLATLEALAEDLGPRFEPPAVLRDLVDDGRTGAAAGEGFYVWENGEPVEPALPGPEIPRRSAGPDDPAR
jgi:3-hydroxybutyryl-CoA dehydrogenase